MSEISTVTIYHEDGIMVINESDFDPSVHKLAGGRGEGESTSTKTSEPTSVLTSVDVSKMTINEALSIIAVADLGDVKLYSAQEGQARQRKGIGDALSIRYIELTGR